MKVAAVIGGNKGIGLALVAALRERLDGGWTIYLTARDAKAAAIAAENMSDGAAIIRPHPYDLSDAASINAFAEHIRQEHGGIDLLIQNGAYAARPNVPAAEEARTMIDTNNLGTARTLTAFRPLLRDGSRVIVVASGFGVLSSLSPQHRSAFDTRSNSMSDVTNALDSYVEAAEAGRETEEGWPDWVNVPSKVGQVAVTRIFARELASDPDAPSDILVNAACPGWTWTDAARPYLEREENPKAQTPEEAAVDLVWLATLPSGTAGPYGELVRHREVLPYGD